MNANMMTLDYDLSNSSISSEMQTLETLPIKIIDHVVNYEKQIYLINQKGLENITVIIAILRRFPSE
jgi:hypothetical protein